jgi:hypothetical protein
MSKSSQLFSVALAAGAIQLITIWARASEVYRLSSPNGQIQVVIEMPAAGSREQLRWSATFRGKQIAAACQLGLQSAEAGELMEGVRLVR